MPVVGRLLTLALEAANLSWRPQFRFLFTCEQKCGRWHIRIDPKCTNPTVRTASTRLGHDPTSPSILHPHIRRSNCGREGAGGSASRQAPAGLREGQAARKDQPAGQGLSHEQVAQFARITATGLRPTMTAQRRPCGHVRDLRGRLVVDRKGLSAPTRSSPRASMT